MYVELKNINKVFGDYKASNNVNFGIEKGKLVALLGPSGSGKTTILRMIAGLEHPDSGDIIIDGKVVNDIPASKRGIGFVFQNYALFRYMTVYDNIAFGLRVQKVSKKKIDERVKELIVRGAIVVIQACHPTEHIAWKVGTITYDLVLHPITRVGMSVFQQRVEVYRMVLIDKIVEIQFVLQLMLFIRQ